MKTASLARTGALTVLSALLPLSCLQAQSDGGKTFKVNCVLCHSADGSGDSATGRALKARDLRSEEVQKQSDAELDAVIAKGKGKMPAFGAKLSADAVKSLTGYIRELKKK